MVIGRSWVWIRYWITSIIVVYKITMILYARSDWLDALIDRVHKITVLHAFWLARLPCYITSPAFFPATYFINEIYNLFPCNKTSSKQLGSQENTRVDWFPNFLRVWMRQNYTETYYIFFNSCPIPVFLFPGKRTADTKWLASETSWPSRPHRPSRNIFAVCRQRWILNHWTSQPTTGSRRERKRQGFRLCAGFPPNSQDERRAHDTRRSLPDPKWGSQLMKSGDCWRAARVSWVSRNSPRKRRIPRAQLIERRFKYRPNRVAVKRGYDISTSRTADGGKRTRLDWDCGNPVAVDRRPETSPARARSSRVCGVRSKWTPEKSVWSGWWVCPITRNTVKHQRPRHDGSRQGHVSIDFRSVTSAVHVDKRWHGWTLESALAYVAFEITWRPQNWPRLIIPTGWPGVWLLMIMKCTGPGFSKPDQANPGPSRETFVPNVSRPGLPSGCAGK